MRTSVATVLIGLGLAGCGSGAATSVPTTNGRNTEVPATHSTVVAVPEYNGGLGFELNPPAEHEIRGRAAREFFAEAKSFCGSNRMSWVATRIGLPADSGSRAIAEAYGERFAPSKELTAAFACRTGLDHRHPTG